MTVGELITKLSKANPELPVMIESRGRYITEADDAFIQSSGVYIYETTDCVWDDDYEYEDDYDDESEKEV